MTIWHLEGKFLVEVQDALPYVPRILASFDYLPFPSTALSVSEKRSIFQTKSDSLMRKHRTACILLIGANKERIDESFAPGTLQRAVIALDRALEP